MKKIVATGVAALVMVALVAAPVHAAVADYPFAPYVVAKNSTGGDCGVVVGERRANEVHLWCEGSGSAWVKVRVRGIEGRITRVVSFFRGDCSGWSGWWEQRGRTMVGKDIFRGGDFDCYLRFFRVRTR